MALTFDISRLVLLSTSTEQMNTFCKLDSFKEIIHTGLIPKQKFVPKRQFPFRKIKKEDDL
jgi:hypothetical protein